MPSSPLPTPTRPFRLLSFGLAIAVTVLSVLLLDAPAATLAHDTFHGMAGFVALTHIVDPLLPLAAIGFLGLGAASLLGWRMPPAARLAFCVCTATLLAVMMKDQLKYAFGRTWPETWVGDNPSWIRDGVLGFHPLHGGQGWASFPSGHMTLVTAPLAVLMQVTGRWMRVILAIPIGLVAIGLYGADFHFVGDIVAGTLTGAVCAAITVQAVLGRPADGRG